MAEKKTYAEIKAELDDILAWFESADVDVEESLKKYEQAGELLKELEKVLAAAELTIKKLSKKT